MTSDDRFDDMLREAARDYNAPPARVPRDEMWERIAAARAARRAGERDAAPPPTLTIGDDAGAPDEVTNPAPDVVVLPTRRRRWQSAAWARALAAALLLAVGIGIGRLSTGTTSAPPAGTQGAARVAAENPTTPPRTTSPDVLRSSSSAAPTTELAANVPGPSARTARERTPSAGPDPLPATRASSDAESPEPTVESPLPYRLAAAEHLALTETLLTTVSADARAGRADSSITLWARDLLGTTRMLLDSPAARDPKLARLLQDLELVLAEVAQLHPTRGGEELRAIDRAVRQRGVLTRLRATMPAGPISAGT